jgi:hypothetical protein
MATPRQIKIVGRNHILPPLGIEKTLIMQSYLIQKQRGVCMLQGICFVKRFDYECSLFMQWLIEPCLMQ